MFRDDLDLVLYISRCQREALAVIHAKKAAEQRGDAFKPEGK